MRGRDDDVRRHHVHGVWHRRPVGSETSAQIIRLNLETPAEMILRPGKLQLIAHHLHHEIGRLVGRQRHGIDLKRVGAFPARARRRDNVKIIHRVGHACIGVIRGGRAEHVGIGHRNYPNSGLYLWVFQDNHKAIGFYETMGGKNIECILHENPDGGSANVLRYVWVNIDV